MSADLNTVTVLYPLQDLLGDVVFVELPDVGMTVKKGGVCMCMYVSVCAHDVWSCVWLYMWVASVGYTRQ